MPRDIAPLEAQRLDRYLWAARFFKTRSLAKTAIEAGRIAVDGQRAKPAKEVRPGQRLHIKRGDFEYHITITGLAKQRGSASVAQTLYSETAESIEARQAELSKRRMERAGLQVPNTKPSKKQRRDLRKLKDQSDLDDR